jgi:hypothetical protein
MGTSNMEMKNVPFGVWWFFAEFSDKKDKNNRFVVNHFNREEHSYAIEWAVGNNWINIIRYDDTYTEFDSVFTLIEFTLVGLWFVHLAKASQAVGHLWHQEN